MRKLTFSTFQQAIKETMEMMTELSADIGDFEESSQEFDSLESPGVVSIVGFIGKLKGRSLLWVPADLALTIAEAIMGERPSSYQEEDVLFAMSEINNVLSGQAITQLNDAFDLSLRLSPPSVFAGDSFTLTTPNLKAYASEGTMENQTFHLNIAIEGGLPDE